MKVDYQSKSKLLNHHQNKPISIICYAMLPLKLCSSPSNYSPFFTGMAKEARTLQSLIQSPLVVVIAALSSCRQSEMRLQ